ncbi:DUF6509 family protein [Paenibacillus sp. GCM10027627]|uniref:DUF6509 family protein n=1 Tax=unclassified Paenibacillus TaxID=185978 RepID=UPI003624C2B9
MFEIREFTIEKMKDPYGILSGDRYEFYLELTVDEEDELYLEQGVRLRVVFLKEEPVSRIIKYEFLNAATNEYIDMEMVEEEETFIHSFCGQQLELPLEE